LGGGKFNTTVFVVLVSLDSVALLARLFLMFLWSVTRDAAAALPFYRDAPADFCVYSLVYLLNGPEEGLTAGCPLSAVVLSSVLIFNN
jgi:hypothetical protein